MGQQTPLQTNDNNIDLVKMGKEGKLLSIEILFEDYIDNGNGGYTRNTRRYTLNNVTWAQVKDFRHVVYTEGFMYMEAIDQWRVIHPMDIKAVTIFRQRDYFKP